MEQLNISTLAKKFSDEGAAYELLEEMRWPNGPECPHCGAVGRAYFLKPKNGQRLTSTGKVSHRRLWKCADCRKKFSVLVGTIFERSHVPLSKWLMALFLMSASKNGVAAYELHRTLGVTNETAWFMMHRLREAMKRGELAETMTGESLSMRLSSVARCRTGTSRDAPPTAPAGDGRGTRKTRPLSCHW